MRFSTVVAVSAAALASSAAALPTPAPQHPGAATPNTPKSTANPTQEPKKLTGAQRGQLDLSTARTDYTKAQQEFKQAQDDLAGSRKMKNQAMGELGPGHLNAGLRSPGAHKRPTHKTSAKKLTGAQRGQHELSTARTDYTNSQKELKHAQSDLAASRKTEKQAMGEYGLGNLGAGLKARDLDAEDVLDSLAARDLFHEDDELFGRAPGGHTASTPVRSTTRTPTSGSRLTTQHGAKTPQKLTGAQRGKQDLSTARTDYNKAEKEYKQAQGDLAASRKMEKQGLKDYGLGNIGAGLKSRDLDVEDLLDSLAARGFFDEDDELFGRAPGGHTATTPVRSTTRTPTSGSRLTTQHGAKTAQPAKKLTGAQRGQQDLSTARTDYNKAEKEFKQAQGDLAASRKMEKQGLKDYGLGNIGAGLKARDMDVEDILDSLAARGLFDEDNELFGRAPGGRTATTPVRSTTRTPTSGSRLTTQHGAKTAQPAKKLTGAQRGQQDLATARTDYNKAEKEFKQAQGDLAASRKMEKQGLKDYGLGNIGAGLKARDLDNVEELMEIIARGYYGANEEY